ncbi:MGA [Mytilus coruscus]|uniref:MGA n=1 Tax=Mytilus coruscus TaxID=42192 RepID=A0A6J8ARL3_MYTCO|nr:MGA [Mytilus coruscus]
MNSSSMQPRTFCNLGCVCCARLVAHNQPCPCWRPPVTVSVGIQTDDGINYGYDSDSYFTKGTAAHTMLHINSEITPDIQKGRDKKRCQRESSSSSEDSVDRESSRWKESHARERSKSSQLPKVPVFTGSSNPSRESFIFQFEMTAGIYEAFLRGSQEEVDRIDIEKNPRTINEALKWIKSG